MPSLIGNKPNQVPSNGDLGTLAFQDSNAVNISGGTVDVSAGTAALPTLGTTGDPNTGVFFPAADTLAVATNGVEAVRVDSSGRLGVGIAPSAKLHSYNSAGGTSARLQTGTTANGNFLDYQNAAGTRQGIVGFIDSTNLYVHNDASASIIFDTNNTERMRIDASGNVGVGVTPSWKFHVASTGNTVFSLESTSANGMSQVRASSTSAKQSYLWQASASFSTYHSLIAGNAGIYADTNLSYEADGAFFQSWWTNGLERMRIDANGNVLVGTTSATSGGAKLQTVDGITFPATQVASANANTLDDYEEGTWTPVIAGNTTAGVGTYTVQAGSYTKIGNRVFFNGWVVWTAHTGTGSTYVDGLPFTVANSNNAYGSVSLTSTVAITLTAGNVLQARTSVNVAQFLLLQAPTGGATPVVVPMSTAGGFMVSGHYTIT